MSRPRGNLWREKCEDCRKEGFGRYTWFSKQRPGDLVLTGIRVKQKGRVFYVMTASARDLDILCRVPVLNPDLPNSQLAQMALAPNVDQWQRPLDHDRIEDISRFFEKKDNFFANAVLISLPQRYFSDVESETGVVQIQIPVTWMKQKCPLCGHQQMGYFFDRCPNHDCQEHKEEMAPGIIIDGQHRIRGTQGTHCVTYPNEKLVVVVLPDNEFAPQFQAKLFTEITTSAVELDDLQKIFLLYKFKMRAPKVAQFEADFTDSTDLGRRNRRAYEKSCHLCQWRKSKWCDRITILRRRTRRADYIEATTFVPILETWLRPNGVFYDYSQPDKMKSTTDACKELVDYLKAVEDTWQGSKYWGTRQRLGALEDKGTLWVILRLFETVAKRIDKRGAQRSLDEFKRELKYFSGIQWGPEWQDMRAPERKRNLLLRILRGKLESAPPANDPAFGPDTQLDAYIRNKPDAFDWIGSTKKLGGKSISKQRLPLIFEWGQPLNAYNTATFEMRMDDSLLLTEDVRGTRYELKQLPTISQSSGSRIVITVTYTNHTGQYRSITLKMNP